jgi:4-amino-4-deoxy-L-arabinose transferase-like glycosyltransferase
VRSTTSRGKGGGLVWLLLVGLLVSLPWFTHPFYDPVKDGSLYVLTARSLLEGEGYSLFGVPFIVRPPGMSVLIAPVLAAFGTSFLALNVLVSLFGVAAIVGLFVLARERVGGAAALAVCVLLWVSPAWQRLCNQVLSDVPATALLLGSLGLERWARARPAAGRYAALGLVVGLAGYVRTLNLLVVPAVLCARVLGGAGRKPSYKALLPLLLVPLALQVPWSLRNAAADVPVPPEEVHLYSYGTALLHERPWDPASPRLAAGELAARVPGRVGQWVPALGALLDERAAGAALTWIGAALVLGWSVALLRRRRAEDFLTGGFLVVLSFYFAFRPRLALPALVLMLPAAVETLQWALARWSGPRAARLASVLVLGAGAALVFEPGAHRDEIERRHASYLAVRAHVAENFPAGAPLAAPIGGHYGVYIEGHEVRSLQIVAKRSGYGPAVARAIERGALGVLAEEAELDPKLERAVQRQLGAPARVGEHVVYTRVP